MPTISIVSGKGATGSGGAPPVSPIATVTASENLAARTILPENLDSRLESTRIDSIPVFTGPVLNQHATVWISADNKVSFVGIGYYPIDTVGQVLKIFRLVPGQDQQWVVGVHTGTLDTVPTSIPLSAMPPGCIYSDPFTVKGLELPLASAITNASVGAYHNRIRKDGTQYGEIGGVQYTDPTDPNDHSFFARVTTEELAAGGVSLPDGGGEREHVGEQVVGGVRKYGDLWITYRKDQVGIRYKIYLCNRNSQGLNAKEFADPTLYTKQSCWPGGANYFDVLYTLPPGALDASAFDPATLSTSFTVNNGKFDIATGGVSATQIASVNATTINGSITANQIGSVNATTINGSITAGQIESVNATTINGALTATQIGTVNATSITGTLTATQIGTVNATSITGTLTATQIGTITAGQIATITAGQITGQLNAGQITTIAVEQITGVLSAAQIGTINATAITGVFTPTQIGSIAATSITGVLSANHIDTITAGQITGLVISSQLAAGIIDKASLLATSFFTNGVSNNGTNITFTPASMTTGTWAAAQIGSVNSGALVGSISASLITSVNAAAIVGYINAANINSINASAINGNITADHIGSINATAISINAIDSTKISGVAAGKLTAGTIVAGMTITAPTINGGSITGVSITGTSTVSGAAISGGSLLITTNNGTISISGTGGGLISQSGTSYGIIIPGACTVTANGLSSSLYSNQLVIGGVQCIDSSYQWVRGVVCTGYNVHTGTLTVDGSGTMQSLSVNGSTSINSSNVFVGAGISCPLYGVACAGVNPVAGGVQYYGANAAVSYVGNFNPSYITINYKGWDNLNYSQQVCSGISYSGWAFNVRGGIMTTA